MRNAYFILLKGKNEIGSASSYNIMTKGAKIGKKPKLAGACRNRLASDADQFTIGSTGSPTNLESKGGRLMKIPYGVTAWTLFFAILVSITAFAADVIGQSKNDSLVSKRARQDESFQPTKFEFSIPDSKYVVLSNGDCVKVDSTGRSRNFSLPLDDTFLIERLDYVDWEGDLIIIYGVTDSDVAGGRVTRIDRTTVKKKWVADIPGFNIGEAVVRHHHLYLSAIGFVGKLDLNSGKYVWQHEDLYDKKPGKFNSFERPVIEKDVVKFTEFLPDKSKGPPVTIVINDHSGAILTPRFK